jgi:hypothetical protein
MHESESRCWHSRRRIDVDALLKNSWQSASRLEPTQLPPTPMFWLQQTIDCACTGIMAKTYANAAPSHAIVRALGSLIDDCCCMITPPPRRSR